MIGRRLAAAGALGLLAAPSLRAAAQPAESDFDRIRRTRRLRTGAVIGQAPYCDKDPMTGAWHGFIIDLARDLAQQMDATLEIVETNWNNAVLDLQSGKVDIFFGLNPTPQRALVVDFTHPLFTNAFTLIAQPGFTRTSWDELNDPTVRIAVQTGTSYDQIVTEMCPKASVTRLGSANEATMAVQSRRADCQVIVLLLALAITKRNPTIGRLVVPQPLLGATTNAAVRREPDKAWRDFVDTWIDWDRGLGRIRTAVLANLAPMGIAPADIPGQVSF